MPRATHSTAPATFRNRNRVTNKTRLRVIRGPVEGDPLAFDEDEEKARVISTAGVDAEDANEHHLQAVLTASSVRHQQNVQRATRGADKPDKQSEAFIPIPDNAGLVEDYDALYPPTRWVDPATYIKMSDTVEDMVSSALRDDFTYYMDDRDKEWLDRNNEEARGEGTSASGAVSTPSGPRTSRSAKAKGKEPEPSQPVVMSEDEFELVMGVFEKVTHDKTPFLHHGMNDAADFPAFADYQETFSSPLSPSIFATFVSPAWIPEPAQLLRCAKAVYPYWRERRIERNGHRIIPILNYDESDVKNESYICFRRRDVKAMRKTRASQASSSDKLRRLQAELENAHELSSSVCRREALKREVLQYGRAVWDGREAMIDLKRKFPALGTKEDDELLVDKERPPRRSRIAESRSRISLKLPKDALASAAAADESIMKPQDRYDILQRTINAELAELKNKDVSWEDAIDNAYQPPTTTPAQRAFKFVIEDGGADPSYRASRSRRGRGGIIRFDRRSHRTAPLRDSDFLERSRTEPREFTMVFDAPDGGAERAARLRSQWRFDADNEPALGPEGQDEADRVLVDDFEPTRMRKNMRLITEADSERMQTETTMSWRAPDGTEKSVTLFRMGHVQRNREQQVALAQQAQRAAAATKAAAVPQQPQANGAAPQTNGAHTQTLLAPQTPIRRSSSAMSVPVQRIASANGNGMRPPATPAPSSATLASAPASPAVNGNHSEADVRPASAAADAPEPAPALIAPKPTANHLAITMPANGHYLNGGAMSGTAAYGQAASGLQLLQAHLQAGGGRPAAYMGHVAPANQTAYGAPTSNMHLKLPAARQMQWAASQHVPNLGMGIGMAGGPGGVGAVNIARSASAQQSPPRPGQSPGMQHQAVANGAQGY